MKRSRSDGVVKKGTNDALLTARMNLRQITEADAKTIVEMRSDPMCYRFFRSPHRLTIEEHLQWFHERYLPDRNRVDWIALLEGQPIGLFSLRCAQDTAESVEVGYLLTPVAQGHGYAGEAVEALLQWVVEQWRSKSVFAEIHQENEASIRFILRMGFRFWKKEFPFVFYRREL